LKVAYSERTRFLEIALDLLGIALGFEKMGGTPGAITAET
jgi:hypothetical protein